MRPSAPSSASGKKRIHGPVGAAPLVGEKRSRRDVDTTDAAAPNNSPPIEKGTKKGLQRREKEEPPLLLSPSGQAMSLAEAKAALEAFTKRVEAAEREDERRRAAVDAQTQIDEAHVWHAMAFSDRPLRFNVGGCLFEVPISSLCRAESDSFFDSLSRQLADENGGALPGWETSVVGNGAGVVADCLSTVERDASGAIFIDRDPETFRIILNYCRGYSGIPNLTLGLAHRLLADAEYFNLTALADEMRYYCLGTVPSLPHQFSLPGAGINVDRTRLRAVYNVSPLGDRLLLCGRHSVTFHIKKAEYVGLGVISDDCVSFDSEFHRTRNCCVYYMTGLTYTNFPFHKKEEASAKYAAGDYVTVTLDMQSKVVAFHVRGAAPRCYSCATAVRLRFAVVIKFDSEVTIVDSATDAPTAFLTLAEHRQAV